MRIMENGIIRQMSEQEIEDFKRNLIEIEKLNQERFRDENRKERNRLLFETDWTQVLDNSLTEDQRQAYRVYRQQLRDLDFLTNDIVWPIRPGD